MHQLISYLCGSSFLTLRRVASIRPYPIENATAKLVSSVITVRLEYRNSICAGLPATEINRLKRIPKMAARLVLMKSKRDHVSPVLQRLHWLPMPVRIDYLLHHWLNVTSPAHYHATLFQIWSSTSPLAYWDLVMNNCLHFLENTLKAFGHRSFSLQAPTVWNPRPSAIRQSTSLATFKTNVKTHVFVQPLHLSL